MTKKAVNAGVDAKTGFALQKNIAIYLILESYNERFKDVNYFVCLEHHDDFLFCFLNDSNSIDVIEAYQSKKKSSRAWGLDATLCEIIKKLLETGKYLSDDNTVSKSDEYHHKLIFVSNQTINLQTGKKKETVRCSIKEDNTNIDYSDLPDPIKLKIRNDINPQLDNDELEKLKFIWIDLNKTVEKQINELAGQLERLFGSKIIYPRAAIQTLISLFDEIENRYNDGSVAKLLDESKRVSSNRINDAIGVITTKSKCFEYWRSQSREVRRLLKIKPMDENLFEQAFQSAFDFFKCEEEAEHYTILSFVRDNINSCTSYDYEGIVAELIDKFNTLHNSKLTDIQLKAVFFAAFFQSLGNTEYN